jgi:CBS domain-containing protein
MKVSDVMSADVCVARPQDDIRHVAREMAARDVGILPVGENDKLVGMITDRDIAIRGIAQGKGPDAKVQDVMTTDVKYCYDDQDVADITQNMGDIQVRRLPVVNRQKRLVGIITIGDIAASSDGRNLHDAGFALGEISRPGGQHSQSSECRPGPIGRASSPS